MVIPLECPFLRYFLPQENLSSPFHVNLAYNEILDRKLSNANIGKQPSVGGFTSNFENGFPVKYERKGTEDPTLSPIRSC